MKLSLKLVFSWQLAVVGWRLAVGGWPPASIDDSEFADDWDRRVTELWVQMRYLLRGESAATRY